MDHCLRIPELIHSIFDNLDKNESLALTLSNRAFLEPGLDRIWRSLESLEPLIRCFPDNIFKINGRLLSLRIPVTQHHLLRYLSLYAHRIHSWLPYKTPKKRTLSGEALQALQIATDFKLGALSPHLRHFDWSSPQEYWPFHHELPAGTLDPYVSLFIGDSLESLDLGQNRDEPLYLGSLTSTTRRLPHLKKLHFSVCDPDPDFTTWYMTTFAWQGLEEITLSWISPKILAILAKLPHLRHLDVRDEEEKLYELGQMDWPESSTLSDFPSIRSLHIVFVDLTYIKTLLRAVSPANQIESVCSTSPYPAVLSEFFETISAIQDICNPTTLRQLEVCDSDSAGLRDDEIFDFYSDPTENDIDISGLSKFVNLEKLVLRWRRGLQLGPREISLIPTWWPRICHLDLCPVYPSQGRVPSVNHTHLLEIVRGCPLLRFLGLRFDTTQIPGEDTGRTETFRLETLKAGESPIVSPSRVATFLKAHFPHLKILHPCECPVVRESTILDRRWAAVAEALR